MLAYEADMQTATNSKTRVTDTRALPKGICRHREKFRIRWLDHNSDRKSEVFNTVKQAETALRKRLNEVDDIRAGLKPALPEKTFDELFDYWWLREFAPSLSYWRDWDKCERLAKAIAHRLENQSAELAVVFEIVRSRRALKKVAEILDDDRNLRWYLKALKKTAHSSVGSREQRDALLGW